MLEWNKKVKTNNGLPEDELPRLVCVGGRCEESVNAVFDHFKRNTLDGEFVGLLHKIYRYLLLIRCAQTIALIEFSEKAAINGIL